MKAKLDEEHRWVMGSIVYVYCTGHITKMVAIPIYWKGPVPITVWLNANFGLTLTYFSARIHLVSYAFVS